jgi:SAM-dependent methyltransferase
MPLEFSDTRPPIPPVDLIQRVVTPFGPEHAEGARVAFDTHPVIDLKGFETALGTVGKEFADFERLLDFGCGPGRFIRHLEPLSRTTEIHGADIDETPIAWLRENVPYGHFAVTPHEPPTQYPDGFFDLVINHSVFTHLDERMQHLWLAELQRIVRPGGVLLLTVQSLTTWNQALADMAGGGEDVAPLRNRLESDGIVFIEHDHFVGSTHPDWYHTTFHAPWYVFERWTRYFDLGAYLPHGSHSQDLVVLVRRPEGEPAPAPIGHQGGQAAADGAAPAAATAEDDRRAMVTARLESLGALTERRTPPSNPLARAKRTALAHELGRQDRIDSDIVAVLHDLRDELAEQRRLIDERNREIAMLRVGLYEQGKRLSIVADQLREELGGQDGDGATVNGS